MASKSVALSSLLHFLLVCKQVDREGSSEVNRQFGMSRSGFHTDLAFAVRIAQSIAKGSESFYHCCTAAQDLLKDLLSMLRGRNIELFCSLPVELVNIGAVVILCLQLVKDVCKPTQAMCVPWL